jgi:hypothetical protein
MDVPTIHVHTQSDKATVGYATFMWETMRSLANHPEALRLSVHGIGPSAGDRLKGMPDTKTYQVQNVEPDKGMVGSTAHGACIEHALSMTDDGDIHVLVDSDTVVVAQGWDDYVRIELLDKGVGTFGTTYEDIGNFTSGGGNVQTYKGIPNVVWMALSPLHSWRGLKALPRKGSDVPVDSDALSKIYNLPLGYHVLRDVAWQIPQYLHDNSISYKAWKQLKPSGAATILKGLSDYHEEYHVDDAVPFVLHQRGSMRHSYRADRISSAFYGAVDRYLTSEKESGRGPRWRWEPNAANARTLEVMKLAKESSATRIAEIERLAGQPTPTPVIAVAPTSTGTGPTINGWLKATLDGASVWNRYTQPVPSSIAVGFTPDMSTKNLRLEGTVGDVHIVLPYAPVRAYTLTVRNLTTGLVTLAVLGQNKTVDVPKDACWLILVDVDGVFHAV